MFYHIFFIFYKIRYRSRVYLIARILYLWKILYIITLNIYLRNVDVIFRRQYNTLDIF